MRSHRLFLAAILLLSLLFGLVPAALASPPIFAETDFLFIFPI